MRYQRLRRALSLCLCCLLLLAAAGCGGDPSGQTFRYDIAGPLTNLDPQFATSTTARMILQNLFEGLLVRTPEGELLPGAATEYTVSGDGLTYTFSLREDATWSSGDALTAEDFVFAFQRMFRDASPHAPSYAAIKGAQAVMDGRADVSALGIRAAGEHMLVIELERPDPLMPERLADPAAAPCNRAAYTESRGRYGLEPQYICCNGPFSISRWDDTRLSLQQNDLYRSERPAVAGNVHFYLDRDAAKQFLDGKTDLALLTLEQAQGISEDSAQLQSITKTVWCIVFNQNHRVFGNALIRQGLAHTVDHQMLATGVSASYQPTQWLIPDAMRVMGKPYRAFVGGGSPLSYNSQEGKRLYQMGLGALDLDLLPQATTILIPDGTRDALNISAIQQGWQKELAAYVNFEATSPDQIQRRLREGDYQMLLMPISPGDSNVATLLGAFASDSPQNYFGYSDPFFDRLLEEAAAQPTPELAAAKYAQAEARLLTDAVIVPLYFEPSYLAVADGVSGIEISPFGDSICFKYGQKQ